MDCADLARIINSDTVQSVLRSIKTSEKLHYKKKNPLTNKALMKQINPFSEKRQSLIKKLEEDRNKSRTQRIKAKRADKKARSARKEKHNLILKEL